MTNTRLRWARTLSRDFRDLDDCLKLVAAVTFKVRVESGLGEADWPHPFEESELAAIAAQLLDPPGGWLDMWLPGVGHEQIISGQARKGRGAWYTPEPLVRGLLRLVLSVKDVDLTLPVLDPTCGAGSFLLAAADELLKLGLAPADVLSQLVGVDIDLGAIEVARWSLGLWAQSNGISDPWTLIDLRQEDALSAAVAEVESVGAKQSYIVIGNPPFGTPLRSKATDLGTEAAATLDQVRRRFDHLLGPYADLAAVHLTAARAGLAPGSVLCMVMPQSVLAASDTSGLRDSIATAGELRALWVAREKVFDAGVRACAPVLSIGDFPEHKAARPVKVATGPAVHQQNSTEPLDQGPLAMARLAARALGAPSLPKAMDETVLKGLNLGAFAKATAGFRDEYYGLAQACIEGGDVDNSVIPTDHYRLVTVGMIDPLRCNWGQKSCRIGHKLWRAPLVAKKDLSGKVDRWVERQLRPKLIVATQSKILEPMIDLEGNLIPLTPVIAVHCDPADLGRIAAVLLAPPVVAWAWQRWFGTALAVDALKLAARQVMELPQPSDFERWDYAGRLLVEHAESTTGATDLLIGEVAAVMNEAYGADPAVLQWWQQRCR